jgi:hypothetical protein
VESLLNVRCTPTHTSERFEERDVCFLASHGQAAQLTVFCRYAPGKDQAKLVRFDLGSLENLNDVDLELLHFGRGRLPLRGTNNLLDKLFEKRKSSNLGVFAAREYTGEVDYRQADCQGEALLA